MKKFLIVAGLLTAIATPAFAQSFDPEEGTGNVEQFVYGTQGHQGVDGEAHARALKATKATGKSEDATQSPADDITEGPAALREFR